jgi:post-segregation antitoxin (ccd killing protein)
MVNSTLRLSSSRTVRLTKVRQAAATPFRCRIEPLLLSQARAAGLNVSRLATSAVAEELDRLATIAELDSCLAELDAELGPLGDREGATGPGVGRSALGSRRHRAA